MDTNTFLTIKDEATGLYKEKGSKFLAFAYPVKNDEEIKERLAMLRKKYYDARHHCYAYLLQPDQSQFRANDDGEPSHSAGDPILGQIKSKRLTDTLVVVVRYFGGTKLGVSGLIHAYKTAASQALENAVIIRIDIKHRVLIRYPYELTTQIMRLVDDLDIVHQEFTDECLLEVDVKPDHVKSLISKLQTLKDMGNSLSYELKPD